MLQLWRTIRVAEPLRLDCTVSRLDGTDYDEALTAEMRAWYLNLLDCGPEEMVVPIDLSLQARVAETDGLTLVEAPADSRRVLSVQFSGWGAPLRPSASESEVRACAANPFCLRPLAARIGPGAVIVSGVRGTLASLNCTVDYGEDTYAFDDRALETIKPIE